MKPIKSFNVDFDYALSDHLNLKLTAKVELHHSDPYYLITDFYLKNYHGENPLLADIKIKAVQEDDNISWVHTDSEKESMLSVSIGKAIEEKGNVEISVE